VSGGGLNIAAVARRTGVGEHTLRKWEQRYGVLRPIRTDGGQRRYSEEDVGRVDWLSARLKEGYRIGEAAAMLAPTPGEAPKSPVELRDALIATASSPRADLRPLLDHAFTLYPLEQTLSEVIAPCLAAIGDGWADGELTVGQEHLTTAAVRARLERSLTERRAPVRGVGVLACAPGEQHEIGLLMLACLLRADGWDVIYLGQSTPVADAVAITTEHEAALLAFSVTMREHAKALAASFQAVRRTRALPATVIGGASASSRLAKAVGARYFGSDLAAVVPALRER
jgi:MerR family transcriptional regulator, light-induced transcriptional regulator